FLCSLYDFAVDALKRLILVSRNRHFPQHFELISKQLGLCYEIQGSPNRRTLIRDESPARRSSSKSRNLLWFYRHYEAATNDLPQLQGYRLSQRRAKLPRLSCSLHRIDLNQMEGQ